jgi:hypothetical protein
MGRPIKSLYFGNRNYPYDNENSGGTSGVGGEGVASVTFSNSGTLYSQGTTVSFGQPNIAGGVRATGTPVIDAAGLLRGVTITAAGTGYTSAPTLTVTTAPTTSTSVTGAYTATTMTATSVTGIYLGMVIAGGQTGSNGRVQSITGPVAGVYTINTDVRNNGTFTSTVTFTDSGSSQANSVALTTNVQSALSITSYITTGSSAVSGGDIIKQEASRRYLVRNSQGVGQVTLSAGTGTDHILAPGFMHLIATDGGGATYYVMKLTAHKAVVVNRTNTSTALVSTSTIVIGGVSYTGGDCGWTLGAATGTNQVTLANA